MVLPRHRPETAHLPERPLDRVVAAVDVGGEEFAGLLRQIQQHRAGFEDRDRLGPALRRVIDHRGNPVVRRDRQELRLELIALADVDREDLVFQPGLFEKHRDLVAVRRGPVIKVDHGAFLSCCGAYPCDCMNFTATGMRSQWRAVRHRGELICQPTRPCSRRNFSPPSVIATLTPAPATGCARDVAAIDRILPDRQPRAGGAPGLDHFGIEPGLPGDPFDEIEHQRVCRVDHRASSFRQKAKAWLRASSSQLP